MAAQIRPRRGGHGDRPDCWSPVFLDRRRFLASGRRVQVSAKPIAYDATAGSAFDAVTASWTIVPPRKTALCRNALPAGWSRLIDGDLLRAARRAPAGASPRSGPGRWRRASGGAQWNRF